MENLNNQNVYNWDKIEQDLIERQRREIGNRTIRMMGSLNNNSEKVLGEIQSEIKESPEENLQNNSTGFDLGQFFGEGEIKPEFGNLENIQEMNRQEEILSKKFRDFLRDNLSNLLRRQKR